MQAWLLGPPRWLRKGRNEREVGVAAESTASGGFSWGPERREQRWRPLSPSPRTHTRTFLHRAAMELEAKDTLWKSEFHSLLAESSFLPGEGVCACVHTRPWRLGEEEARRRRENTAPVFQARAALAAPVLAEPDALSEWSEACASLLLQLWLEAVTAKHASELEKPELCAK